MPFETSITNKCRLLCPECWKLRRVKSVAFDERGATVVTLVCQHLRGELLPSKPGSFSIERCAADAKRYKERHV
jgi:hypothetical protein